jgi:hypothetical protein
MSNKFIVPGTTTTITFLEDRPFEGVGKFGPYKAYRVRTEDGVDRTLYPSKYLLDEIEKLGLTRGSVLRLRAEAARTKDGRPYTRIDIDGMDAPRELPREPARPHSGEQSDRILPCVALKAAAQTRGIAGEPGEVIAVADKYLEWLRAA